MIWIYLIVSSWLNSLTNFYTSTIAIICVLLTALYQEAYNVHFNSVTQSCLTLCSPMDCSTPRLPVHSLLRLMSIELVMPSNHLILCRLLLLSSVFPSISVFSSESVLHIRWPKVLEFQLQHQSFWWTLRTESPLGWTGSVSLQSKGLSRVFSNITVQKHQFFDAQLPL